MKQIVTLFFLLMALAAHAQSKEEVMLLANARAVSTTVFGTKDSATLVRLFSDKLSYGHSGGKIENKTEAIHNISHNQSTYSDVNLSATSIWIDGPSAVTRYTMTATETTKDGKVNALKLHIVLFWTKEKKEWKLLARQAVKLT